VTIHRIASVTPTESVDILARIARSLGEMNEDGANEAVAAIGMYASPNMIATLSSLAREEGPEELQAHSAFWLGMKGGEEGRRVLRQIIDTSSSEDVRNQAITGIAQDESRAAIDFVIELARRHPTSSVRQHATFWLGQIAGEKATANLREATDDPDEEVKEMAVFALSQLPKEQAVPELIALARTHASKGVREQAIFWLGQSGDPRALDFLVEVASR
jgi:HEAT repeat protein